jgi:DNA-binding CsgD family transcriptional regulator
MGARPLAESVAELARRGRIALDGSPDPAADVTGGRLTVREREVLGLLAGGMTNRQIAERLFISPKTASVHVTNIKGKLGVSSRVEAATEAVRLGIAAADGEK